MFGLAPLDLIVITLFFAIIIAIGIWAMRRVHNQEDYFLAGRRFGKFIQTFAAFGQSTSPDTAVGAATTTFSNGASGMWSSLIYLFSTPAYWLTSPWYRRMRLLTLGDFFIERYGSIRMGAVYAVVGTLTLMALLSAGFSAMTKTILAMTPKPIEQYSVQEKQKHDLAVELENLRKSDYQSLTDIQRNRLHELELLKPQKEFSHLNQSILIWLVCVVVMIYAMAGGLASAFITDIIKGFFILVLSILLFPFAFHKINSIYGGSGALDALRTMHQQLGESVLEIFGSPSAIDFTWYYILSLSGMGLINVMIQPNQLVAIGSAKDEYTSRGGFVTGCFMKRFCSVFWGFLALLAIVLYRDSLSSPDLVLGYAAMDLLGPLNMGLLGLMIACLMASMMSVADCQMITCSGLLTHNLYRPFIKNQSERHYIFVGRIFGACVILGAGLIATQFDTILQILKLVWELNVIVAASFWLGLKWRRATRSGAWCSIVITALIFYIIPMAAPAISPSLRTNPALLKTTHPKPMEKRYVAGVLDVQQKQKEIDLWKQQKEQGIAVGEAPTPLQAGTTFTKQFKHPMKSIFWTKDLKLRPDGMKFGDGMLNLELLALDRLGVDLENNPYALNETLRILIRTIVPFLILMAVSYITQPEDRQRLNRFFVKMKTVVHVDPQQDQKELELSYATPHRFDHLKLFPNSNWELDKWDRTDVVGFLLCILGVFAIIGTMTLLVSLGG